MSKDSPDSLDSFYKIKPVRHNGHKYVTDYENDWGFKSKYQVKNKEAFRESREIIGNLIINKMRTSGGTDVDWLIEHNGGFILFEIKRIWGNKIVIRKAQMWAYQRLQEQLKNCHIFFVAHEGIDFTNPNDLIYVQELSRLVKDPALHENVVSDDEFENEKGYAMDVELMDEKTVDELRDEIDKIWNKFDEIKEK